MLDVSKKYLRFRNRCGTSGNAMEIVNIFGRVAALGHTYFRVVCCCLSVLARVLHPCVALGLWKILRGCGWAMAAARSWGGRISLTVYFLDAFALRCCGQTVGNISQAGWFCTFLHKLEWRWKASHRHFVLAPTCLWKLRRKKHLRITQCVFHIRESQPRSMWNVQSQHSSWNRALLCL